MFPWGCFMVSLQTSASFSYTLSNQPVFYATHNQSYPSASEERAARSVGFGEYVGGALTHKLLDDNRNMSKSKGWTLQSSLLMLWMGKTRVNNQTTIDDR